MQEKKTAEFWKYIHGQWNTSVHKKGQKLIKLLNNCNCEYNFGSKNTFFYSWIVDIKPSMWNIYYHAIYFSKDFECLTNIIVEIEENYCKKKVKLQVFLYKTKQQKRLNHKISLGSA